MHTLVFWFAYAVAMSAIAVAVWCKHKALAASRAEVERRRAARTARP